MPRSWLALTGVLLSFAAAATVFLATATFPRKEAASGVLRLSQGEVRVTAPRAGIVTALHVTEGAHVAAGAPLAYVNTEQLFADGGVFDARMLAALDRERAMLDRRLAALDASEPPQREALVARAASLAHQLTAMAANRAARQTQAALARESAAAADVLAATGNWNLELQRSRRQQAAAAEQAVAEIDTQMLATEGQRVDALLQLAKLPTDLAQSRASILNDIAVLEEKRANAVAQNGFVLVARTAGTVTALQARLGQPVDASKPLMTLIPDGSTLRAEIYVPSRAIGFVAPGQGVRLMYDAFPYTRFGQAAGRIAEVASTVLTPDEVVAAVKVTEPVYRVTVALDAPTMAAYGRQVPLQSGMALTADIILESRSFLALLLDPLLAARGRVLGS